MRLQSEGAQSCSGLGSFGKISMVILTMKTLPIEPSDFNHSDRKRFWDQVQQINDLFSCWEWDGAIQSTGYGTFKLSNQTLKAHRVSWILTYDKIPDNLFTCHHCDNKSCVRPSHLFVGTQKDNIQDAIQKERFVIAKGENNPSAKLSSQDVVEIRRRLRAGRKCVNIAQSFRVHRRTIGRIKNGEAWSHLCEEST